jgi:diaminohydroxyphosphoribosylaminopyrimidine deaminase/5-amino-6-(5-phosphoribosylamino)uracil reductase
MQSRLVQTIDDAPLVIVTAEDASADRAHALEDRGATIVRVESGIRGLHLGAMLVALGQLGLTRLLCEGGPHLASALIEQGFADEVALFSSVDKLGTDGRQALDAAARNLVADRAFYTFRDEVPFGTDRLRLYDRIETACSPDL